MIVGDDGDLLGTKIYGPSAGTVQSLSANPENTSEEEACGHRPGAKTIGRAPTRYVRFTTALGG